MNPDDRDAPEEHEPDLEHESSYEEPARSIFSALWFRVVLVGIVLAVIAAVAVPYVLEWLNPEPPKTVAVKPAPPAPKMPAPAVPPAEAPTVAAAPAPAPQPPASALTQAPAPPPVAAKRALPTQPVVPKDDPKEEKAPAKRAAKPAPAKAAARASAPGGAYFVQVGAFKDPVLAQRLTARLRDQKFSVDQSVATAQEGGAKAAAPPAPAPSGAAPGDRYDVFVTGGSPADLGAKLSAKGLATAPSGAGVVVKPSLPLRDAVALSKDLAVEGLKVQVKRASSGAAAPAPAPAGIAAVAGGGETLHRVRVGPFADRAAATAALRELEGKGYKGFIARGGG